MINVILPLAGGSAFFEEAGYQFPKPLIEVTGKPMIELIINNLLQIRRDLCFIFILRKEDCIRYHLDYTLNLLTNGQCIMIRIDKETKGAICSCLLAVEQINNSDPLIICNSDQLFEDNPECFIMDFEKQQADAGIVFFESVHPRWSFIRLQGDQIVEAAEKKPISRYAIAGFYYFRCGQFFVEAAMESIRKDAHVNNIFYTAPVLNELVLNNYNLVGIPVAAEQYHTFYSPQRIEEYEKRYFRC